MTEDILGYAVHVGGTEACVAEIAHWIDAGDGLRWLACLNPHSYVVALEVAEFDAALRDADWLVPDGVGVVLASRVLGGRIKRRVTGADVFVGVNRHLEARGGGRVFFLGATEDALAEIRQRMQRDFPHVVVAGTYSPSFQAEHSEWEVEAMIAAVNAAAADVVWVGMTAPKQERWVHRVRGRIDTRFAAAVGAVFDFYSGRVTRSHQVFQWLGLEWLPRLVREPRRLWRRMFVSAPRFVWHVVRARARRAWIGRA